MERFAHVFVRGYGVGIVIGLPGDMADLLAYTVYLPGYKAPPLADGPHHPLAALFGRDYCWTVSPGDLRLLE